MAPATKLVPAIVMLPPTVPVQPVTVGAGELAVTLSTPVAVTPATVTAITCAPVATIGTVTTIVVAVGVPITCAFMFAICTVAPGANPVPVIVLNELIAAAAGNPVMTGFAAVICNVELAVEPPIFTTTGYDMPVAMAGTVMVIVVDVTALTGALTPLMVTVAPEAKLVPVMVAVVPGAAMAGEILEIVGVAALTVSGCVLDDCPLILTKTFGVPAATAGTRKLSDVPLRNVTPVAAVEPTVTLAPAAKLVPVAVIVAPGIPEFGDRNVSVGAGTDEVTHAPVARTFIFPVSPPNVTEPVVQSTPFILTVCAVAEMATAANRGAKRGASSLRNSGDINRSSIDSFVNGPGTKYG